jgi:carbon-monoxide dehydrogenase medium subunit
VKPAPFEHHGPESLEQTIALLAQLGDDAKVLAGGQSLVPLLALRLSRFDHLIDINRVAELVGVRRDNGHLRLGALTRHTEVVRNPEVSAAVPLLATASARIGHFQIRNRGTLGGAIAHGDPAAEQPAVAVALDASIEAVSARGVRQIAASEFFLGTWTTALDTDEVLTAVSFPVWIGRCGFAVEEVARRAGDFALAGVVCGVSVSGAGAVDRAALGLFGVGSTPVRASGAEAALLSGASAREAGEAATREVEPSDDLHASADYRRRVTGVLVERAITRALEEATRV